MKIKYRKIAAVVALLVLCLTVIVVISRSLSSSSASAPNAAKGHSWAATVPIDPNKLYKVIQVVDGDTFKALIDGHSITIRLLGVNAPETVKPNSPVECYGPEASAEMKSLLIGKNVLLALNPDYERIDKYGRLLAYARLENDSVVGNASTTDGVFINEYLVKRGYAREYTFNYKNPYQYQKQFQLDESIAKEAGKGLWGKCASST